MNATISGASGASLLQSMTRLAEAAFHQAVVTIQNIRHGSCSIRSRINVENTRKLKEAGFPVGTRFTVNYQPGMVELVKDDNGTNVIAPKTFPKRDGTSTIGERLDLRSSQIHEKFAGEERVLALYLDGRIVFLHLPTVTRGLERAEKLVKAVESGTLRTAALYAGIATLDAALHEGFKKAGLNSEMVFANDSWDVAVDCMLNDNPAVVPHTRTFTGGIEQFIASGMRRSDLDMLVLGIPCRGASKLNIATRSLPESHEEAGHQVLNAVMALQQLGFPPLVLVENVRLYSDSISLSMLERVLREQGYQTMLIGDRGEDGQYLGINSNDYGDIERRVRMALLAYPMGVELRFDGMVKTGPSKLTVGDIRLPEASIDESEYLKGAHLNSEAKIAKGWRNRVVDDSDNITPSISAACWKMRPEDAKFKHPMDPTKSRLPFPEEHAALKGHDKSIINSLTTTTHAHTALGNGTAKKCWVELARVLGSELRKGCSTLGEYVRQMREGVQIAAESNQPDLFQFA